MGVESIRDLGVILDRRLTFSYHTDAVVSKANKIMGILMRSVQTGLKMGTFHWKPILTAYYGSVRALLENCRVIWGGAAKTGSGQNIEKQNIESQNIERKISKAKYRSCKISKSQNIEVAEYRVAKYRMRKISKLQNIVSHNIE